MTEPGPGRLSCTGEAEECEVEEEDVGGGGWKLEGAEVSRSFVPDC